MPELVRDINPIIADSNPLSFVQIDDTLYFTAFEGITGRELWKSDGTEAGTVLVKDISPGAGSLLANLSSRDAPRNLTNVGGTLYFSAGDGTYGIELWKSDGTEAGTVRVKDIRPDSRGSYPSDLTNVGGTLYFTAFNGTELWKSDGTEAGTVRVKDIYPGSPGFSNPLYLTDVGGTLYFRASDFTAGTELWKSDGTESGTVVVKDIYPGTIGSLRRSSEPRELTNVGGTLYFTADDGTNGRELWKSDGTEAGTVRVKDIYPGTSSSGARNLTIVDETLYFTASDDITGDELWKSDGTEAGTLLVKDIYPGAARFVPLRSEPDDLTNVDGTLYFTAIDGTTGRELWKSDGTEAGTVLVKDIAVELSSIPRLLTNGGGTLYFQANDGTTGIELWKSDGTEAGTVRVKDIFVGLSSDPRHLTNVGGTIYFQANDGISGIELWKSDATESGTVLVKDIRPGLSISDPLYLTNFGGTLYFQGNDGTNDDELWKSDGSESGTVRVKDINPGTIRSSPRHLTSVGDTLYFVADDGTAGHELWKSDGTESGTVLVKDIAAGTSNSFIRDLTNVGGTLYFRANDGTAGHELWKSDGTESGTVMVKDINPGMSQSYPNDLTIVEGTLYFSASGELWKSDGTESGTVLVKDIVAGTSGSGPRELTNVGGTLYFKAYDITHGIELWKSDGTAAGTVLVKDINPGTSQSYLRYLTNVGGTLYFRADDGTTGGELWKSDGTESGTVRVKDINPGTSGYYPRYPRYLTNVEGTLYFTANDGTNGVELWKSDGTESGTVMVADLAPGNLSSEPQALLAIDKSLFFTAITPSHGRELWKLNLSTLSADAGGPYFAQEGQSITLDATGSSPEATLFEWDLDGDGSFETVGQSVSFLAEDSGVHAVSLRVTGPSGTALDTATIEVENLPPVARVNGVLAGFTDLLSNLRLFADDPSPVDRAAGFDYEIDYDGDGTIDDVVSGPSGTLVSHVFNTSGVHQVQVTAVDKDGGRSNTASHRVVIIDAVREADAEQPELTNLVWTGTNGDDHVVFTQTAATTVLIEVHQLDGVALSPSFRAYMFGINGRVIADGLAGNDLIDLDDVTTISAEIYGGEGQDTIFGTQAADVIYANGPTNTGGDGAEGDGGEGRPGNHIYAGGGDDVLFGARGRDYLDAGTGRNLIHAGRDGAEGRDTLIGASAPDLSPQSDAAPLTAPAEDALVDELAALDEVLADWNDDSTSPVWST